MNTETITQIMLVVILGLSIILLVLVYEDSGEKIENKELEDKVKFLTKAFAMNHINENDPDWECKKWVGIVELAKQDYPHFVEETLLMAEKKCGFDVNEITS